MTEPVLLEEAKKHLRVEHDDENDLILNLITAAREYCEGFQNIALVSGDEEGETPLVSARVKAAILLLVGHWYENRQAVSEKAGSTVAIGVSSLLWQERIVPI